MTNNKNRQVVVVPLNNKRKREEVDVVVHNVPKRQRQKRNINNYQISRPITAPISGGTITGSGVPRFRMKGDEIVCVSNTEIFNTIASGLVVPTLAMNQACIPGSFIWLSNVALNFGKWRWKSLRIIYIPTCSTSQAGGLTLGFYYDTIDATPTSRAVLSAARDTTSIPVWAGWEGAQLLGMGSRYAAKYPPGSAVIDFDVTKCQKPWYPVVTAGSYAAMTTTDRNVYSPGVAYAVIDGLPISTTVGTVYASYEIEFIEPVSGASNN